MLAASASLLNVPVVILDVGEQAPAKQILAPSAQTALHLAHVDGSFSDPEKIRELAAKVDVLTVEIEHVGVDVLEEVRRTHAMEVHPAPSTIRIIQDKFRQKEHLQFRGIPVATFRDVVSTPGGIEDAASTLGLQLMLKSKTLAYDGRSNFVLHETSQVREALDFLGERPLYAEKWAPFDKEIAVMVVQTATGQHTLIRSSRRFTRITSVTSYLPHFEVEMLKFRSMLKRSQNGQSNRSTVRAYVNAEAGVRFLEHLVLQKWRTVAFIVLFLMFDFSGSSPSQLPPLKCPLGSSPSLRRPLPIPFPLPQLPSSS